MELKQLIVFIVKRWKPLLAVSLLLGLVFGLAQAAAGSDPHYEYLDYYRAVSVYEGDNDQLAQYYAQTKTEKLNSMLGSNHFYMLMVRDEGLRAAYEGAEGKPIRNDEAFLDTLKDCIDVVPSTLAETIEVKMVAHDAEFARLLNEAYENYAHETAEGVLENLRLEKTAEYYQADPGTKGFGEVSILGLMINIVLGFGVVFILYCGVLVVIFVFSGKVRGSGGIRSRYTIPVLGTVTVEK